MPFKIRQLFLGCLLLWRIIVGHGAETPSGSDRCVGLYQSQPGELWTVADTRSESGRLSLGMPSGEVRSLTETGDGIFHFGPAFLIPSPIQGEVRFSRSGERMVIKRGTNVVEASRVRFTERALSFQSDGVKLSGTLILPPGDGPFPAIIDVHGSGPATRALARAYAEPLVLKGFAAFAYDKRGVGESQGDFSRATLGVLASDAAAAAAAVARQPEINPHEVGLWGHSQGGWVGVKAARLNPGIAFIIARSGPATSPAREGIFEEECRLRFQGYSDAQVREAGRLMRLNNEVTRGHASFSELEAALGKLKGEGWFVRWDFKPLPPNAPARRKYAIDMDFDPATDLKQLEIPSLWLFGALDMSIPVQESIAVLTGIRSRHGKNITIELSPTANHAFFEAQSGADEEIPTLKRRVSPQPVIHNWLRSVLEPQKAVKR